MYYYFLGIAVLGVIVLLISHIKNYDNPNYKGIFASLSTWDKIRMILGLACMIAYIWIESSPDSDNPLHGRWSSKEIFFDFDNIKHNQQFINTKNKDNLHIIYPLESNSPRFTAGSKKYCTSAKYSKVILFFERNSGSYQQCLFYGKFESSIIYLYSGFYNEQNPMQSIPEVYDDVLYKD